jgi:hypothetical protein
MYDKYSRLTEIHRQHLPSPIGLRFDYASRPGNPSPSELPVLTRDILLKLQLEQHHLQTLPGTSQRLGSDDGDVAYISREFS